MRHRSLTVPESEGDLRVYFPDALSEVESVREQPIHFADLSQDAEGLPSQPAAVRLLPQLACLGIRGRRE
jgi:hypothetical protein